MFEITTQDCGGCSYCGNDDSDPDDKKENPRRPRGPKRKWIRERTEKGAFVNIFKDLELTDVEGFRRFMRMDVSHFQESESESASSEEQSIGSRPNG